VAEDDANRRTTNPRLRRTPRRRCPTCRSRKVIVTAEHMGTSTCFCAECARVWDRRPRRQRLASDHTHPV